MTKKRREFNQWLVVALGAGLILLALLVATTGKSEPEYSGKTLSEWLEAANMEKLEMAQQQILESAFGGEVGTNSPGPAAQAIRNIGDQALPYLLRRLQARESWLTRAQDRISELFEFVPASPDPNYVQGLATVGFEILGTNGWPAIPELSVLLSNTNSAMQAAASMCQLGVPGIRAVRAALLDPKVSDTAKAEIVFALTWWNGPMQAEVDQSEIIPIVMGFLDSPVERLRLWSALYFSEIHGEPAFVVPQLVGKLDHPDPKTRAYIARALGTYGTNGVAAIPKLEALLKQPDEPAPVKTLHDFYRAALKSIRGEHQGLAIPQPPELGESPGG
jgi:HEAT repeat protein